MLRSEIRRDRASVCSEESARPRSGPYLMPLVVPLWKFCSSCGRPSMASNATAEKPNVSTNTEESSSSQVTAVHSRAKPEQKSR